MNDEWTVLSRYVWHARPLYRHVNTILPLCRGDSPSSLTYIYKYKSTDLSAVGFAAGAAARFVVVIKYNRFNKDIPHQKVHFCSNHMED